VRVVVVGTGFGARVVAPAFAATGGVDVAEVVSARDDRAVAAAITEHRPDLVSVHSPPFLHARHAGMALESGSAVLCDKPLGVDAADSAAMVDAAEAAGVRAFVNFEFRWAPARRLVRDVLHDGAAGRIDRVSWSHLSSGTRVPLRPYGWLFDAGRGGGWVGAWASHAVDALFWLLGAGPGDVVGVAGARRIDVALRPDPHTGGLRACTAEDGLSAVLTFTTGVTATLDSGFAATTTTAPRLVVAGSEGTIECVADEQVTLRRHDGERTELTTAGDPTARAADRHGEPMRRLASALRAALAGDEDPSELPTFHDGHAVDLVLDRLRALPLASRPA
jgi:predicted dehydrogenase